MPRFSDTSLKFLCSPQQVCDAHKTDIFKMRGESSSDRVLQNECNNKDIDHCSSYQVTIITTIHFCQEIKVEVKVLYWSHVQFTVKVGLCI